MKRMHIHVGVADLQQSVGFYSALFGSKPDKVKADYARWMLEDPRINFAISTTCDEKGVEHLGLQVDSADELEEVRARLKAADQELFDEGEVSCCYANSVKSWVKDPSGVAWESFQTMADIEGKSISDSNDAATMSPAMGSCC